MWKTNGKATTLLISMDTLFPKIQTNARSFLWRQSNLEVNFSSIRISAGSTSRGHFGFKSGKETREAIGILRIISKRTADIDGEKCACFTGWQKASDRVNWTELMWILRELV
jgi:hypothetical protein